MTTSQEARSVLRVFNLLKNLELQDASEDFDIFYIFMKQVEQYADKYKSE